MENMKNNLIAGLVIVGAVLLSSFLFKPEVNVTVNTEPPFGSASSPSVIDGNMDVNGVQTVYRSSGLNQASTTICSLKSPAATSTLVFGSVKLTTGTTTAIALELAKDTTYAATTTRISYDVLASGVQETLTAFVASTTGTYGALGQYHTADEQDLVFAPNTYLNAKYGGAAGSLNVLVGSCKAEFVVN